MAVSKRTRYEVLNRDGFSCRYCHETDVPLTIDHVVPVALGGSDRPDNLVAACQPCNAGKSSVSPDAETVAEVTDDAVRWAAAMKLAASRAEQRRDDACLYVDHWANEWVEYRMDFNQLPPSWSESIANFHKAGLPLQQLIDALSISMTKAHVALHEKFRYMCGIAWSMVTEMQDEARAILAEQDESDGA